jgi:histidinol-phosphate/aromatic aminotransferase/cobyric acid decarboxylase-like protein
LSVLTIHAPEAGDFLRITIGTDAEANVLLRAVRAVNPPQIQ